MIWIQQPPIKYTWELAIQVYDDTYDEGGVNVPVSHFVNKEMGISIAYCDNDETNGRENFIGLVDVSADDYNSAWQDASVFGKLTLLGEGVSTSDFDSKPDYNISIYPTISSDIINIEFNGSNSASLMIPVYDLNGRLVMKPVVISEHQRNFKHDIGMLNQGMYIIKLTGSNINHSQIIIRK